jgi:hypothetical protein
MKKILVLPVLLSMLVFSCTKTEQSTLPKNATLDFEQAAPSNMAGGGPGRGCATNEVHARNLLENPGLAKKMNDIEAFTQKALSDPSTYRIVNGILEIPVHINLLYRIAAENISVAQLQSQIDVLNKDFAGTNTDYNQIPALFSPVAAGDVKIKFIWTSANVTRKSTTKTSWGTRDAMKSTKSGGLNPVSPTTTLNIWVCTIGGGILGYAQFPGGRSSTDGIVLDSKYVGVTTNTGAYPYNLGRTATHEVGHYFNLRHIWGDATCGTDLVADTPPHNTANYGVPIYPHLSTCAGTPIEMTMNYMDYTDDRGMYMFSALQSTRMQATFAVGGPRASLR